MPMSQSQLDTLSKIQTETGLKGDALIAEYNKREKEKAAVNPSGKPYTPFPNNTPDYIDYE